MKLKRSFSVSLLIVFSVISFSCSSNLTLVPGETSAKISNIYTEYYNLGESYFKLEDYSTAIKYYSLAMNNRKNYWASYYKLAKCYVYQNNWNEALPMYKKLLKRDQNNNSLKAGLAYIYLMQNDFNNSFSLYKELLEIENTNKDYLENIIALLLSDEKRLEKNEDSFNQYFQVLQENYPDNENIIKFQNKYNELKGIEEQNSEEVDSEIETDSLDIAISD